MPRKKKRKDKPSTPRFSLGFRIALYYTGLMLRTMIPHLILFAFAYMVIFMPGYYQSTNRMIENAERYASGVNAPLQDDDLYGMIYTEDSVLAGELPPGAPDRSYRFSYDEQGGRVYFRIGKGLQTEVLRPTSDGEQISEKPYRVAIVYDLTSRIDLMVKLLLSLLILEFIRLWDFLRSGRAVGGKLFKPIGEIARTAQNLSASNLSERIYVEGTRDELRDLASVINEMLDRIEAAYNSQKQFVSDASHELRTPIAVIQGYAEMLDRWGKTEPDVRDESIAAILSETHSMMELVEKLLFLARHDKNTLKLEMDYFDAAELAGEIARDTALIAGDHVIRTAQMDSSIVTGDRVALKQALRIFVDNALKFTPAGGKITISCKSEKPFCRITVADTGQGIEPGDMEKVFDRFYRADAARSGETPGHGLGLSIARIIVLSHGGKIEVQSKPGVGSRFSVVLPM